MAIRTAERLDDTMALDGGRKVQRGGKRAVKPASRAKVAAAYRAERWAKVYTASAVALSSGLNGYAAVVESKAEGAAVVAAAAIGVVLPVLVWMLGTVTAWTYKAGWRRLSYVSGGIAACMLALSVCHVASALAKLTGSSTLLAGLFAVGIDCGLVSSEATAIMVSSQE